MMSLEFDGDWAVLFARERARLFSALGDLTEGGIVEQIEHIGATSLPDPAAHPPVDICLSVWPFPLDATREAVLQALGYEPVSDQQGSAPQRFWHSTGTWQLFFFEAGSGIWTDYRITSGYLRHDRAARLAYLQRKQSWEEWWAAHSAGYELAKSEFFLGLRDEARRWWMVVQGWSPVEFVRSELQDFKCQWYVSSGWALDLYLDRVRRVHEDVDIVIKREDQLALQAYMAGRGWRWLAPKDGRMEPWPAQMYLELPRHQVHAFRSRAFIDFLLTEMDYDVWHYRRDPNITRAAERAGLISSRGIPYLAPELVLLFKSKNTSGRERKKDEKDFQEVFPHLEPERRAWLLSALAATEPDHAWIGQLKPTT